MVNRSENVPSGQHASFWIEGIQGPQYPQLSGPLTVDVAIVGGGIVGIMCAKLLKEAGFKVAVIEASRVAQGVTGHTTAKLTSLHGLFYHDLIKTMGRERAKMYADANQTAIQYVAACASTGNMDCDFHREFACTFTETDNEVDAIQAEVDAALSLGLPAVYLNDITLPVASKAAIRFDDQAYFHPRKFLLKCAQEIPGYGSVICEMTRVNKVDDGTPCIVHTDKGEITARFVIIGNNFPFGMEGLYFAKMEPNRSYLLAASTRDDFPSGMFYQVEDPNHTVRLHVTDAGEKFVLVGGQGHKTGHVGDTIERYRNIEKFARERLTLDSIEYRWSTQDNRTIDRVPFIGPLSKSSKNVYVATGFKGWGMTHGIISGFILTDLIAGRENPWAPVFDPRRHISIHAVDDLIGMALDSGKHLFGGPLSKLAASSVDKFKNGEAGLARIEGETFAAHKDAHGELSAVSPNCTHMGCVVSWNNGEESWDCPCHGSRFNRHGFLEHGPATKDLEKKRDTGTDQ